VSPAGLQQMSAYYFLEVVSMSLCATKLGLATCVGPDCHCCARNETIRSAAVSVIWVA